MANLELTVHDSQPQLIAVEKNAKKTKKEVDDPRRDEWSTEGINSLLDIYEAKWNLRNRGNLRGGDWEDVALRVSARSGGSKAPKTPFQCKNKVASMKQKYRSETLLKGISGSATSRWPFFPRMDLMLRVSSKDDDGTPGDDITGAGVQVAVTDLRLQEAVPQVESGDSEQEVMRTEQVLFPCGIPQQKIEFRGAGIAQNRHSNQEDASNTMPQRKVSGRQDSDTSTPRSKAAHRPGVSKKPTNKHRKHLSREVATSIRSFADSILKLEEAKMEMFKDSERLRAELEARRVDMELKRTEIIMSTQLQIARLLSGNSRKRKASKPVNVIPCTPPSDVSPSLHSALQLHSAAAMQTTLPGIATQPLQAIPLTGGALTPGLVHSLHCAIPSKQC